MDCNETDEWNIETVNFSFISNNKSDLECTISSYIVVAAAMHGWKKFHDHNQNFFHSAP